MNPYRVQWQHVLLAYLVSKLKQFHSPCFAPIYSGVNEYRNCWESIFDGLISHPGEVGDIYVDSAKETSIKHWPDKALCHPTAQFLQNDTSITYDTHSAWIVLHPQHQLLPTIHVQHELCYIPNTNYYLRYTFSMNCATSPTPTITYDTHSAWIVLHPQHQLLPTIHIQHELCDIPNTNYYLRYAFSMNCATSPTPTITYDTHSAWIVLHPQHQLLPTIHVQHELCYIPNTNYYLRYTFSMNCATSPNTNYYLRYTYSMNCATSPTSTITYDTHSAWIVLYPQHQLLPTIHIQHELCYIPNTNYYLRYTYSMNCATSPTPTITYDTHSAWIVLHPQHQLLPTIRIQHELCYIPNTNYYLRYTFSMNCATSPTPTITYDTHSAWIVRHPQHQLLPTIHIQHELCDIPNTNYYLRYAFSMNCATSPTPTITYDTHSAWIVRHPQHQLLPTIHIQHELCDIPNTNYYLRYAFSMNCATSPTPTITYDTHSAWIVLHPQHQLLPTIHIQHELCDIPNTNYSKTFEENWR